MQYRIYIDCSIDENGIIIKANDKVKAADDPENMLKEING